ncbi:hypothetical protein IMSAGC019_01826 [Lachnospiraceae bacterium]|nr:hypothetical protein IMSAGC019_01826 [Lachnospiraceae bacterium]
MVIENIVMEEFGWHIFTQLQIEWCYLAGEYKGMPIVIELTSYVTGKNYRWWLVPIAIFGELVIESDLVLYICSDDFNSKNVILECSNIEAKKYDFGIYSLEMKIDLKGIGIYIRKNYFLFQAQFMNINNNMLRTAIIVPNILKKKNRKIQLVIAERITKELWQYEKDKYLIGDISNECNMEALLPYGKLISEYIQPKFFDFKIIVSEGRMKAEYFLYPAFQCTLGEIYSADRYFIDNTGYLSSLYQSNGKNLSLQIEIEEEKKIEVQGIQLHEGCVLITLVNNIVTKDMMAEVVFKKRAYGRQYEYSLNCRDKVNLQFNTIKIDIRDDSTIGKLIKGHGEFWDVYLLINGELLPIYCSKRKETGYFAISDQVKICFFFNSDYKLSIYTHEGVFKDRIKVKIAVLGTCFSRSVFKSDSYFNPDYKRFYECVYTQFHSSLISIASKPCKKEYYNENDFGKEARLYLPTEFNKDFFEKFADSGAEYLIIDNYVDATRPIAEIEDGSYITYNKYLIRSKLMPVLALSNMLEPGTKNYKKLYRIYAEKFINKIKKYIPERNIFLLQGRFSYWKINEKTGERNQWDGIPYIKRNGVSQKMGW